MYLFVCKTIKYLLAVKQSTLKIISQSLEQEITASHVVEFSAITSWEHIIFTFKFFTMKTIHDDLDAQMAFSSQHSPTLLFPSILLSLESY